MNEQLQVASRAATVSMGLFHRSWFDAHRLLHLLYRSTLRMLFPDEA